jgi:hypothetical protein
MQAVAAWNLPELFAMVVAHVNEPCTNMDEFSMLCSLHYADVIAERTGNGIGPWPSDRSMDPIIEDVIGLPEEELETLVPLILLQIDSFGGKIKAA